ncbi:MAG: hypothetical protein CFE37_05610 [Alphaproteobacteria bacterium PA4]|nr:MAG: hypothetical protein CFE37_05610 [Alphaproteobacteria bacterium PA4]
MKVSSVKRDFVLYGLIAALLAAGPVAAATIQQDFDAAQALLDAGKGTEAREAFANLLTRFAPGSRGVAASLVRARLGDSLLATGDAEAAEPMLVAAIAGLKGDNMIVDRNVAIYNLARAQEEQGRFGAAAATYAEVRNSKIFAPNSLDDIGLRAALARAQIWSNPKEARRLLDELLALPKDVFTDMPDTKALLQSLRGRIELNDNKPAEARRWFTMATTTAGGRYTRGVNVADIRVRNDLALANYKLGHMDEVQKATAYSGAGSLSTEGLTMARGKPLPACAPVTGLAPDAMAVVEFALGENGRVISARTIYADRGSGAAPGADAGPETVFAQAVRRWIWAADDAAKLDSFWRQSVRVELRCSTERSNADPVVTSFALDIARWSQAAGLVPMIALPANDAEALPLIRAELARRTTSHGAASRQLLSPLYALAQNDAVPKTDREAATLQIVALLSAAQAPGEVLDLARIEAIRVAALAAPDKSRYDQIRMEQLVALLANQTEAGRGSKRIAMATRLALGQAYLDAKADAEARSQFDVIAAAPLAVLSDADPIRIKALLYLSNIAAASRDTAVAAKALAATGLSSEQCSLVDVKPQPINRVLSSSMFPAAALAWRTQGFVRIGYDITAAGQTINIRTLIASPPFIFGPPTERIVAKFRFQPVFRPDNAIGCSGSSTDVNFRIY